MRVAAPSPQPINLKLTYLKKMNSSLGLIANYPNCDYFWHRQIFYMNVQNC